MKVFFYESPETWGLIQVCSMVISSVFVLYAFGKYWKPRSRKSNHE